MRYLKFRKSFGRLSLTIKSCILLVVILISGCASAGEKAGVEAARIIANDIIPQLTGESDDWQRVWEETRDQLPGEVRAQAEIAFTRAISAAGSEFRCNTEFIRSRLHQDLEKIVAQLRNEPYDPVNVPTVCDVLPQPVVELDDNFIPLYNDYILFVGYDLDNAEILLEHTDGTTEDLSGCCLDNPTHYNLTVKLSNINFNRNLQRFVLRWSNDERSVAIVPPRPTPYVEPPPPILPQSYWTADFSEEGTASESCASGYAMKGLHCSGNNCDNMSLYCVPYMANRDDFMQSVWAGPVSDETAPLSIDYGFVLGLSCEHDNCDNIGILFMRSPNLPNLGQCHSTPYFSEEGEANGLCEEGSFVSGLSCRGNYCDDISLICCRAGK